MTYIPHNTYLVYGDEESLGRVRALGPSCNGKAPSRRKTASILARRAAVVGRMNVAGSDLYAVQLVADPATNEATSKVLDTVRVGAVRSRFRVLKYENVILSLDPAQLATLAERPDVVSIQPYVVPRMRDEKQGQILAGALSGGALTGPGYLSFLGARDAQDRFPIGPGRSSTPLGDGTTAPNHFGLCERDSGASRVVYNRLEGLLPARSRAATRTGRSMPTSSPASATSPASPSRTPTATNTASASRPS